VGNKGERREREKGTWTGLTGSKKEEDELRSSPLPLWERVRGEGERIFSLPSSL